MDFAKAVQKAKNSSEFKGSFDDNIMLEKERRCVKSILGIYKKPVKIRKYPNTTAKSQTVLQTRRERPKTVVPKASTKHRDDSSSNYDKKNIQSKSLSNKEYLKKQRKVRGVMNYKVKR